MKNAVANTKAYDLSATLNSDTVKRKFHEVLGKNTNSFISSLLTLTNANAQLKEASTKTVLAAAMTAATLKLPINANLGFAYIVPYKNNKAKTTEAQFQLGYKGFIQLAMRSGQYKTLNVAEVYEGEIEKIDRFTGEIVLGERTGEMIVGYIAYFKLVNGFEKYLYMSKEEIDAHGKKYSAAYRKGHDCLWVSNFDAMAKKTVLKQLISKYGIMSIEMQDMGTALAADQAVIKRIGEYEYVDNQPDEEEPVLEHMGEERLNAPEGAQSDDDVLAEAIESATTDVGDH